MTLIVFGPAACGKTSHAGTIARAFGLRIVVDDWDPHCHMLTPGALHLTNVAPGLHQGAKVFQYRDLPASVRSVRMTAAEASLQRRDPRHRRNELRHSARLDR